MTQVSSSTSTTSADTTSTTGGNSLQDLDVDIFLTLMLQELQNQDPLDPTDNQELISQIGQIREIAASDALSKTLDSVLLGQNVTTAAGLIGSEIEGLTDEGSRVVGDVQQVAINDGEPILTIATETSAQEGSTGGSIEEGNYNYEVVWEAEGTYFSVNFSADTDGFDDFDGSIKLNNIPETSVPKKIYRSNKDGSGEMQRVGTITGDTTTVTDQKADSERSDELIPESRQILRYADSVEVRLSRVSSIEG